MLLFLGFCFLPATEALSASQKAKPSGKTAKRAEKPRREAPLNRRELREAEQRLSALGYWTGPVDGVIDGVTRHALIAFQKVTGRPRTGRMTRSERAAILRAERPAPRDGGPAHVEVDLVRQVLFFVDDTGVVTKILPVSSGNGKDFFAEGYTRAAITPPGRFEVMKKIPGWKKSKLGMLYYPSYLIGGIAIHGYQSVPSKPASHGCIRIPMFAAKEVYRRMPIGTWVIVHEGKPLISDPAFTGSSSEKAQDKQQDQQQDKQQDRQPDRQQDQQRDQR